jgi:hypothetical protein
MKEVPAKDIQYILTSQLLPESNPALPQIKIIREERWDPRANGYWL